jgi:hypothetical protein
MKKRANFWPLDFDQEVEIYDNPSWNLPGRRKKGQTIRPSATPKNYDRR